VSSAGIAKFECKKRHFAWCIPAQPSRGRKSPLMFCKTRKLPNRRRRSPFSLHLVHGQPLPRMSTLTSIAPRPSSRPAEGILPRQYSHLRRQGPSPIANFPVLVLSVLYPVLKWHFGCSHLSHVSHGAPPRGSNRPCRRY